MKSTQGARLVAYIRAYWDAYGVGPTYMSLLGLGISTCPHKRLSESEPGWKKALKPGERLLRGKNAAGLVTFQITRGKA